MASVIQQLPDTPLDIIGDVHGELDALQALLAQLGYTEDGHHPEGRKIVFVGDLVDRGLDSPGVLAQAKRMILAGNAFAVLGNHELNILLGKAKDGTGWFFDARQHESSKFGPFQRCLPEERAEIVDFLSTLPLALVRDDLRIVHAAWSQDAVEKIAHLESKDLAAAFARWEAEIISEAKDTGLEAAALSEKLTCTLTDKTKEPPFLPQYAAFNVAKQMGNPIKVLTSGIERVGREPFWSSGEWRFVERVRWWDEYEDAAPVIMGHYWRRLVPVDRSAFGKGDPDLFSEVSPQAWHGKHRNVFCMDYSVGARWVERGSGHLGQSAFHLGAMRWPEREVVLENGLRFKPE